MIKVLILTAGICTLMNDVSWKDAPMPSYAYEEKAPEEDVDLLARCITAEMGYNKSEDVYYYAGSVVINRMKSDDFPTDLVDVIYQKGQYQCTWNGHIEREPDELAVTVANALLLDGTYLPEDVVFQAEFKQGSEVYAYINNTYFCYK